MKWNNRLKSVLTKTQKSDQTEDCLETELRIAAESQKSEVSAVIRSDEFKHLPENQTFSSVTKNHKSLVSAVIRSSNSRDSFKNNDELREIKSGKLYEILNGYIEAGVTFDVSTDDLLVIDPAQSLKLSDLEFLQINKAAILCQLQQSLLTKHLFSHSPEQFKDFAFEIKEREAIMTDGGKEFFSTYCAAVKDVTKTWFARLLNSISEGRQQINQPEVI